MMFFMLHPIAYSDARRYSALLGCSNWKVTKLDNSQSTSASYFTSDVNLLLFNAFETNA